MGVLPMPLKPEGCSGLGLPVHMRQGPLQGATLASEGGVGQCGTLRGGQRMLSCLLHQLIPCPGPLEGEIGLNLLLLA